METVSVFNRNIIIITGASSGLGKEFSKQILNEYIKKGDFDFEFFLFARSNENLQIVQNELISILKEKITFKAEKNETNENETNENFFLQKIKIFPVDLCGSEGVKKFASILEQENLIQKINIKLLINNAGFGTYGPFEKTPLEKELSMIELNCTSLTGISYHSIKYMEKNSTIINVASLASFMPLGNFAVYGATKAYVLSFSVALAAELKEKGIFVASLCPGSVSTNFANVASNGERKEVLHGKDPEKVVKHCLKKVKNSKRIILMSPKWKITAFLSRFAGRYCVARFTYIFNKRPYKYEN